MSLHDELLDQAERLSTTPNLKDNHADLRRAVSAAYYALFHRLIWEYASRFSADESKITHLGRQFQHNEIRRLSDGIANRRWPQSIQSSFVGQPVDPDLISLARTFGELQEARHEADYALSPKQTITVSTCRDLVEETRMAFAAGDRLQAAGSVQWITFLQCLMLYDRWNKQRG